MANNYNISVMCLSAAKSSINAHVKEEMVDINKHHERTYIDSVFNGMFDEHSGGHVMVYYTIYPEIEVIVKGSCVYEILLNGIVKDTFVFSHPNSEEWYYMTDEEKTPHEEAFLDRFSKSLKIICDNVRAES